MIISVVLIVAILMAGFEVPMLRVKKLKKELWAFSIFMIFAVTLCIIDVMGVIIPNPLEAMEFTFKPLSELIFKWLS